MGILNEITRGEGRFLFEERDYGLSFFNESANPWFERGVFDLL
jgi:hypothetical protein